MHTILKRYDIGRGGIVSTEVGRCPKEHGDSDTESWQSGDTLCEPGAR